MTNQHPVFNLLHLASSPLHNPDDGAFLLPSLKGHRAKYFLCISCQEHGWEHVSVSILGEARTPTWEEMCFIKSFFWEDDEAVMQLHPPKQQWVNNHPYCLHLWRPAHRLNLIPLPPSDMVGRREDNKDENKTL